MELKIKLASDCKYDLVSLGECMIRFSPPGHQRIEFSSILEVYAGGAEYNVAYALARYGLRTAWVSKLVDNPLGQFIKNHALASGMDISEVVWVPYDGVGKEDRIGLNFVEVGTGVRPSVTVYDRGYTAISHILPNDVNWDKIFRMNQTRWFHTSGVFSALSDNCAETAIEAMRRARESGTIISYDLNYRSKLWESKKAVEVNKRLVPFVDVLIGNEEDFQKALGFEVKGVDDKLSNLPVESYKAMVGEVTKTYPNLKIVGTTLREVKTGLLNNWSAIIYCEGEFYESRKYENLEVEDRIGGGDGFCSGLIYGLLNNMTPKECVEMGAAHGALLQSTRGDTSMVTLDEIKHVMANRSARIKR